MRANGHHSHQPPDHTSILIHIASEMGRVKADVWHIRTRQSEIKTEVSEIRSEVATLKAKRPLTEYLPYAICLVMVAAASAGKVGWSETLPSLLGLVAK